MVIHPLTDDRRMLPIEKTGELLEAAPGFQLVVSYNPGYQHVLKDLKPSTRQRFVALEFDFPPAELERRVVMHEGGVDDATAGALVELAGRIRRLRDRGLAEVPSSRLLVATARLIAGGIAPVEACRVGAHGAAHRRPRSARGDRRPDHRQLLSPVAEPEDVIAEAALHATAAGARRCGRRRAGGRERQPPRLQDLRRRLELFVGAVFPDRPEIGIAEPAAPPSLLARLARRGTAHLHSPQALSIGRTASGSCCPARIELPRGQSSRRYRLLALEQARAGRAGHGGRNARRRPAAAGSLPPRRGGGGRRDPRADVSAPRREPPRLRGGKRSHQVPGRAPTVASGAAVAGLARQLLAADPASPRHQFVVCATPGDLRPLGT